MLGLMQRSAEEVYEYIRSWLGGDLNDVSARAASKWPRDQLVEFGEQWPEVAGADLNSEIASLGDGSLRPITALSGPSEFRHQTLLSLLLYAPALVVPADDLLPDWYSGAVVDADARRFLMDKIAWLGKILPLVKDGSLVFSQRQPNDELSALINGFGADVEKRFRFLDDMSRGDWEREGWLWPPASDEEFKGFNRAVALSMGTSLELASRGAGQALALETVEEIAFKHVLAGKHITDDRVSTLKRLGEFEVPDFSSDTRLLLSLRGSDEWESWRAALRDGVALVSEIPDSADGAKQASAVLTDHLKKSLFNMNKTTRASPALNAARTGSKGFAVSGIAAATGVAVTGDPSGLLAGAVSGVADAGWEYVQGLFRRRKSYAVLDTVIAFTNLD